MNPQDIIKNVLGDVEAFNINDLPSIDLYMDQVLTYLNEKFSTSKRYEDDKLLTKTMINNYAKSRLLPPPEKKKYSKDHVLSLIMIYFLKSVVSINDVNTVIHPLLDETFHNNEIPLQEVIQTFLNYVQNSDVINPILDEAKETKKMFKNVDSKNSEYMETLALITTLSYDVFIRKRILDQLIDSIPNEEEPENKKGL